MNKGELNTLLTRYLKRVDLTDLYDAWIQFTQSRIDQQLRLKEQEYRTITVPTSQFIALPDDFIEMRHIQTDQEGVGKMDYVTPGQLDTMRALYQDSFSNMRFYTIMDNQIEISPAPGVDSVAQLEMFYYAKEPALDSDGATTKVLTAYPQLYVYGCMIEASAFRQANEDSTIYAQLWRDYAMELNNRQQAARFSGDSLQMRIG